MKRYSRLNCPATGSLCQRGTYSLEFACIHEPSNFCQIAMGAFPPRVVSKAILQASFRVSLACSDSQGKDDGYKVTLSNGVQEFSTALDGHITMLFSSSAERQMIISRSIPTRIRVDF